jgi:CubicO group peptidase (beta-lactamase class C family)
MPAILCLIWFDYHRIITGLVLLLCILSLIYPVNAQQLDTTTVEAIDAHILKLMDDLDIPGVAIGIVIDNQVVYLQGYGIADDSGRAVTPQTPFILASVSKSFTGLAIMQLAQAGQLELDSPVSTILDWFPYESITVQHLLYQTSGFSSVSGSSYLINQLHDVDALENTMHRVTTDYPPTTEAGANFAYSNTNYDLLGLIVQAISGQSFEEYVETNIFIPLEMSNSYTSLEAAHNNGLAQGYAPFFNNMQPAEPLRSRGHIASAGLIASAEDMTHYHLALLNGGRYKDTVILAEGSITALHTPGYMLDRWNGYAMGWWRYPFWLAIEDNGLYSASQPYVLEHDGSWNTFRTFQSLVPERKQGIVVLTNSNTPPTESLYYNLPYGILQLLNDIDNITYTPANEDFLTQNTLKILRVMIIIWFVMALLAVRRMWQWWYNPTKRPTNSLRVIAVIGIPLMLDAGLIALLMSLPGQLEITLDYALAFMLEVRLVFYVLLILAIGWGTLRTLLYIWLLLFQSKHSLNHNFTS